MNSNQQEVMPEIKMVALDTLHKNPNNPRIIKDDKFKNLVASVIKFPEMLRIRPIVVDTEMMILGGNMRYEACKSAGLTEIPIIHADGLTEEQKQEFIIKDNLAGGAWNWEALGDDFELNDLIEWVFDEWELGLGPNPNAQPPATDEEKTGGEHTIKKCICPECGHEFEA